MTKLTGIITSESKLEGNLGVRNEINVDIIGTGPRGKEGKSAYETWLDLGNEGTEQEYLASLKGERGPQGEKGERGPKGDKGDTGEVTQEEFDELVTEVGKKANKVNEAWITPTLINGWRHGNAGTRYYKDELGRVHLVISLGDGSGTMFTLPIGYRPRTLQEFWCNSGGNAGILRVFPNGNVTRLSGGGTYVISSGISFRAEG